jgi:hypothetical protein
MQNFINPSEHYTLYLERKLSVYTRSCFKRLFIDAGSYITNKFTSNPQQIKEKVLLSEPQNDN